MDATPTKAIRSLSKAFSRTWIGPELNDYHWALKRIFCAKFRQTRKQIPAVGIRGQFCSKAYASRNSFSPAWQVNAGTLKTIKLHLHSDMEVSCNCCPLWAKCLNKGD